jgi:DnaJ-domain-containing protein 1
MFGNEADKRIPVTITLANGETHRGSVASGASARLEFELNREGVFLNFKDATGQIRFIAKSTIVEVVEGSEEKKAEMPQMVAGQSAHRVLRIAQDASQDAVRQAYVTLAKLYHPDQYPSETTAPEVLSYVNAMFQQITLAYSALKDPASKAA